MMASPERGMIMKDAPPAVVLNAFAGCIRADLLRL
jgi:hypothetical protein